MTSVLMVEEAIRHVDDEPFVGHGEASEYPNLVFQQADECQLDARTLLAGGG